MLKKNKKIIIFGSKGFLASNLIKELKKEKVNFIDLSKKKIDLLKTNDCKKIPSYINQNDTLIFISAIAPVKDFKSFDKNIQMICNFLNSVEHIKINHLIYVSSDAVYSDSVKSLKENSETLPDNLHGLMHITREYLFKNSIKNLSIVRPTLIYGINDPHNGYGPNSFYRMASKNLDIKLFGKGEELRDHVHISDVSEAIYKIADKRKMGIYNLCSGKVISFFEIAKIIINETKSKSKIVFSKRKGLMPHNGYRAISNFKVKNIINKKFLSFKKGVSKFQK